METTATPNIQESAPTLLARFLSEEEESALASLEKLLTEYAEPVIRRITRFELGFHSGRGCQVHDQEDARSEAILQLITRLTSLRESPTVSIEDFSAYVAGIAYHCCNRLLNRRYPARSRLKNQIRYVLNHHSGLVLWQQERGDKAWFCGLADWPRVRQQDDDDVANGESDLNEFVGSMPAHASMAQMKLDDLLPAIFRWRGRPMALERVVKLVAGLWNVQDVPFVPKDEDVDIRDLLPDLSLDVSSRLEQRCFLERLWKEICELPQQQRAALLLNLRDAQQRDALALFTVVGITTLRQVAETLSVPLREFPKLWNRLPLDDLSIAQFLGLSRQQVINLRKCARERLARRMARWEARPNQTNEQTVISSTRKARK